MMDDSLIPPKSNGRSSRRNKVCGKVYKMKEGCCWMEWCRVGLVTEQGCGSRRQRRLEEGDRGGHGPRTGQNTIGGGGWRGWGREMKNKNNNKKSAWHEFLVNQSCPRNTEMSLLTANYRLRAMLPTEMVISQQQRSIEEFRQQCAQIMCGDHVRRKIRRCSLNYFDLNENWNGYTVFMKFSVTLQENVSGVSRLMIRCRLVVRKFPRTGGDSSKL